MKKLKSIDRRLLTIILIVFVQMLGAAMILPILPLYAQDEFNLQPQYITLLGTAFFVAQFIAGPFLGRLSDRIGRVPVLIVSQIGTVISFLMLGLAPNVAILFLARTLDGITGGNIIVAQAYIADITPPERKTESFGYVMAAFGVGFILGPAIGGGLAATFGPRIPYFMAATAAAVVVLLTFFTLNETVSADKRAAGKQAAEPKFEFRMLFNQRTLLLILVIVFVLQMVMGVLQSTLSLYADAIIFADRSASQLQIGLGVIFGMFGISQILTQGFLLRKLLPKLGETGMVLMATLLVATSMFLMVQANGLLVASLSAIMFAVGFGSAMPSLNSLATMISDESLKGQILGIVQSSANLGVITSGVVSGFMFALSPHIPYWMGFGLALALLLPVMYLRRAPGLTNTQGDEAPAYRSV